MDPLLLLSENRRDRSAEIYLLWTSNYALHCTESTLLQMSPIRTQVQIDLLRLLVHSNCRLHTLVVTLVLRFHLFLSGLVPHAGNYFRLEPNRMVVGRFAHLRTAEFQHSDNLMK